MRVVIAVCVGLFGLVVGSIVGAVLGGTGGAAGIVGLLAGLVGGYLLGRQTFPPKPRPPMDTSRRPNQVIRRDRREG